MLLLGLPGVGKSAFCRALGNEVSRPTLTLDVGGLYGSLVGETERNIRQALRTIDAMQPVVVMVDEIEKSLSGLGGSGDSGVSTRLFGSFLTWLSDHESDVYVVASCNDISKLPPEFSRAERWDAVFFVDLPGRAEKDAIWRLYLQQYELDRTQRLPDDTNFTGPRSSRVVDSQRSWTCRWCKRRKTSFLWRSQRPRVSSGCGAGPVAAACRPISLASIDARISQQPQAGESVEIPLQTKSAHKSGRRGGAGHSDGLFGAVGADTATHVFILAALLNEASSFSQPPCLTTFPGRFHVYQ